MTWEVKDKPTRDIVFWIREFTVPNYSITFFIHWRFVCLAERLLKSLKNLVKGKNGWRPWWRPSGSVWTDADSFFKLKWYELTLTTSIYSRLDSLTYWIAIHAQSCSSQFMSFGEGLTLVFNREFLFAGSFFWTSQRWGGLDSLHRNKLKCKMQEPNLQSSIVHIGAQSWVLYSRRMVFSSVLESEQGLWLYIGVQWCVRQTNHRPSKCIKAL